ncbi:hypothetical protein KM043_008980 [Ampulex compressa]|nr:hypothetical protein KM043_008980 [Ampulex compressa]
MHNESGLNDKTERQIDPAIRWIEVSLVAKGKKSGSYEVTMKSVQEALSPLLLLASVSGFRVFEYPPNRPWPYLTAFYILLIWIVYGWLLYNEIIVHVTISLVKMSSVLYVTITNVFVALCSISLGFFYGKTFRTCLERISAVDDTLESLGYPKKYSQTRLKAGWVVTVWILLATLLNITDSSWWYLLEKNLEAIMIPFVLNYTLHVNTVVDIIFGTMLLLIGSRFQKLNERLEDMSRIRKARRLWSTPTITTVEQLNAGNVDDCKNSMSILMHLHRELREIALSFNVIFGVQMTLEMLSYFVVLTGIMFEVYLDLQREETEYFSISLSLSTLTVWAAIYISKLLLVNVTCGWVMEKASETESLVQKVANITYNIELHNEISQFLFQIIQRPLRFTGNGLFHFGYEFIHQFFAALATFLVIMLQVPVNLEYLEFL